MEEIKIREDGIYLNNHKLKGAQAVKTKARLRATMPLFV